MRPIVAATSVAALALALGLWARHAPVTTPSAPAHTDMDPAVRDGQRAALARIISRLDKLGGEYALGVDANGALAVHILRPALEPANGSDRDRLYPFSDAVDAEAAWIDGYAVTFPEGEAVDERTPDAVLAAGLSPRPGRFRTRAEAHEWFPALADSTARNWRLWFLTLAVNAASRWCPGLEDKIEQEMLDSEKQLGFCAYDQYRRDGNATAVRDLQRVALQGIIDCLDRQSSLYELLVSSDGMLNFCPLETGEDAVDSELDDGGLTRGFEEMASCYSSHISVSGGSSYGRYDARRVKRGVRGRGRYAADDVIGAGLAVVTGHFAEEPEKRA